MIDLLPFGPGAWAFIGAYLLSTIGIGWLARRARREDSLADFYLAGRGFGVAVLLMTMFATQYSGNTFLGFTGNTYRQGYAWVMSLHFMTAVVVFYLLFAPQLRRLAVERGYVTPPDFLHDRFAMRAVSVIGALVMIVALGNYLLAQLMAMGRAMQGLAGGGSADAYRLGVVGLAFVMVLYGTLGGMRAVAWTDAIQGVVMFIGIGVAFLLVFEHYGTLGDATRRLLASGDPALTTKVEPPGGRTVREWLSYVLMFGLAGSLYPQAIQRIYAARSTRVLRRSLAVLVFLPLPTTLMAVTVGIVGLACCPGLEGPASDRIFTVVLRGVQQSSLLGHALVVLLISAVLAAMMSTADSALLSISSMLTNDLYRPLARPAATQAELTRVGKVSSWVLILALVALAVALEDRASLIELIDRKFDLLIQLAPAYFLGVHWRGLRAGPTLAGMLVGLAVALALAFGPWPFVAGGKVAGVHPGLCGLAVNAAIAAGGSLLASRRRTVAAT